MASFQVPELGESFVAYLKGPKAGERAPADGESGAGSGTGSGSEAGRRGGNGAAVDGDARNSGPI